MDIVVRMAFYNCGTRMVLGTERLSTQTGGFMGGGHECVTLGIVRKVSCLPEGGLLAYIAKITIRMLRACHAAHASRDVMARVRCCLRRKRGSVIRDDAFGEPARELLGNSFNSTP